VQLLEVYQKLCYVVLVYAFYFIGYHLKRNLFDGSEKCLGVEKATKPERVGSAFKTPRVKLVVTFVQFY